MASCRSGSASASGRPGSDITCLTTSTSALVDLFRELGARDAVPLALPNDHGLFVAVQAAPRHVEVRRSGDLGALRQALEEFGVRDQVRAQGVVARLWGFARARRDPGIY